MTEKEQGLHLVFYDGQCGLCDRAVQQILKIDRNKIFMFAPLQGKTADKMLQTVPESVKNADSIILIENFEGPNPKIYLFGKAVFRILWLVGGWWTLIGWKFFLPSWLYDWGYRIVAKNRHRLFPQDACVLISPETRSRFLE